MLKKQHIEASKELSYSYEMSDLAYVKWHLLKKYTLSGEKLKVADINNDGKISVTDLAYIKWHLLGKYTIKGW